MKKNLIVYKLRKYLEKLYEGYPTHAFHGYEKETEVEKGVKTLEEDKIIKLVYRKNDGVEGYRLTAEGLKLVEQWHNEKLVKIGIVLSVIILILMIVQIYLTIYNW